jgi:dTDP-4-amino-4,6-dideoxygalactose transaminase
MWRVQLHKISYDEREYQAVKEVLDSGWISVSQKTDDFETAFSKLLEYDAQDGQAGQVGLASLCLAVSSCTAALHIALIAIGVTKGDEVIAPALTFVADHNVIRMTGAENVLADIASLDDWSINCEDIEARITPRTKAVIITHYAGYACDMERISALCKRHKLFLIEDCAHTPGADYRIPPETGQPLGTFGDIAAFSFFANKNIATGEGGMIATRNPELYANLKRLRSHGMSVPSFDRFKGRASSYDVESFGLNYRIHEISSALGLVQLQKLEDANNKRKKLTERYFNRLDAVPLISIPYRHFSRGKPSYHIMPILLSDSINRPAIIESMKQDGVQTSIHYPAIQGFAAYRNRVNSTPKAEYVCAHELTLPLFPDMTFEDVDIVCDALIKGIKEQA